MQQAISRHTKHVAAPFHLFSTHSISNKPLNQKNTFIFTPSSTNPNLVLRVNSDAIEANNESTVTCPFSGKIKIINQAKENANASVIEVKKTPGPPHPMSMESAIQVTKILTMGLHKAMVEFFEKYGPICR